MSARKKQSARGLTDDERRIWGGILRSVKPLRRPGAPADPDLPAETPATSNSVRPRKETAAPAVGAKTKPLPGLATIDRRSKQRLARGREAIDARIDLHGRTQAQAHAALLGFLRRAQRDGKKFVLVITGKGERAGTDAAGERGVLRRQVPLWLSLPEFRPYVLGFDGAHAEHGGGGALYVRLRKR